MKALVTSSTTVALIALLSSLAAPADSRAQEQGLSEKRIPDSPVRATSWSPSALRSAWTLNETKPLPLVSVFPCRVLDTSLTGGAASSGAFRPALAGTPCPTSVARTLLGLVPSLTAGSAHLSGGDDPKRPAGVGVFWPAGILTQAASASATAKSALLSRRESEMATPSARQGNDQELWRRYTDSAGKVRHDLWLKGILQFQQMKTTNNLIGVQWTQIGPSPLIIDPPDSSGGKGPDSGLVRDIAIDPRGAADQTIYIATDNGGIWKTTDAGMTWQPKTDFMPSLSMGAVALDPGNPLIVYGGTGNYNTARISLGVGIYKSTDGGDTWTVLGSNLFAGTAINRIVIPVPDVLLIASGKGLYRSVDGGLHFGANPPLFDDGSPIVLGGGTHTTNKITDLKVDTSASAIYVAAAGSGSVGGGIFESTNGGVTFPSPSLFRLANGATDDADFIAFAQSTVPDNKTMYTNVSFLAEPAFKEAMFKSVDRGVSWQQVDTSNSGNPLSCQCFYDQTVGVDPQDSKRVYFGNRVLFMSTDGGATGLGDGNVIDTGQVHSDDHALVFSPPCHVAGPPPTRLYTGTDGGIATTGDGGSSWTLLNGGGGVTIWPPPGSSGICSGANTSIATVLFRQIDIGRGSSANNVFTYGAAQDLGISSHRPECPGTPWYLGLGGDAVSVAVDPRDPSHVIASGNPGFTFSSPDGTFCAMNCGGGFPASPGLLYFDPNGGALSKGGNATAYGTVNINELWQSTDNGVTFDLMHRFCSGPGTCPSLAGPTVTAINITKLDSNAIWVGLSDGTVASTIDAMAGPNAVWTLHVVAGAPNRQVSGIAIDPSNVGQVVAVYPDGLSGSSRQKAFMTFDGGATWTDIGGSSPAPSSNLPNVPLNAVVIDPNTTPHSIIVASDAGVMRTVDLGASWVVLGEGLPTVQCPSLAMDSSRSPSLLRVGTYGRSAFELLMGSLAGLSPAHFWVGLRNSDDQGTQFDLKAELLVNGTPVASGLQRCVTRLTRNPAAAKEVVASFGSFPAESVASGDVLALRVSARIGTNADDTKCAGPGGSHKSAVGLRLYYDSASRPSRFDATITPNPNADLYLRSDGGPCPNGDGQSPGVTTRSLDTTVPAAAGAKCKDSGVVNFANGNPFSLIGTWSLAPLP